MNVYEVNINETYFWVASESAFEAMNLVLEKREAYEDEEENFIKSTILPEDKWDTQFFDDMRDESEEGARISVKEIMDQDIDIATSRIIASESD